MNFVRSLLLGFFIFYLILIGYIRATCWRDPTSPFFQPERAHTSTYSTHRIQQANEFADHATAEALEAFRANRTDPPTLCVGIPSVRREGVSYLKLTLGSLQQGLSAEERGRLRFVVLLAHVDPTRHPDHDAPWLRGMADELPAYRDDEQRLALARQMEAKRTHGTKSKFDYALVMEECKKTRAPYILMLEDDVVFLDGWMHRTMEALANVKALTWEAGYSSFLYLRLFYYEGLLGWNSEAWPTYLGSSALATGLVLGSMFAARQCVPQTRVYLTRSVFALAGGLFMPLLVGLFFAAGRNCVMPQRAGVQRMDRYACCGQGLVFPRSVASENMAAYFDKYRWEETPTDSLIEQYADATGALRWALTPVVMQHVGGQSSHSGSRGGKYGPSHIWNYGFETNDPKRLAQEHLEANARALDESREHVYY
ncbi:integral membrane protein [Xylariaceae sp. FL0594]|nr:integral membrane protein [Xylariaceae sp. FL0594]